MAIDGVTRQWHDEDGWGVVDSVETPGGCWAGFSEVVVPGYRRLLAGQRVWLEYERAEQDGYAYRATRVWPLDADPWEPNVNPTPAPTSAYRSELRIHWEATDGPNTGS